MKRTILASLAAAVTTTVFAAPTDTDNALVKDTTKVIDIEEVVVIATPKENNRLRQQAISSTSLSQNEMRNNSVTSVKALSGLVPNLFIPDYGSKLTTSVYVRGIGSRINTPAVGLYVDNIPFIDKSAFDFNYSDIERIDVMRGPQGTLYGRNTMGGLIRVFTKSPFTYSGNMISVSAQLHTMTIRLLLLTITAFLHSLRFLRDSSTNTREVSSRTTSTTSALIQTMSSEDVSAPFICLRKI